MVMVNILAMILLPLMLCVGVKYGLDYYTRHGEKVTVPNVVNKDYRDAENILDALGIDVVISDTDYIKRLPPGCVLKQTLEAGTEVKPGRVMHLVINALSTPMLTLPDVIDNGSKSNVVNKLRDLGFKVDSVMYVIGEKDWVYGILCKGRRLKTGDQISIEDKIVVQAGNGLRDDSQITYVESEFCYASNDSIPPSDDLEDPEDIINAESSNDNKPVTGNVDVFEIIEN